MQYWKYIVGFSFCIAHLLGQLLDNYDGVDNLTYTTEGSWSITGGKYEAQTGGSTTPEHSYASYDLSQSNSNWTLSKTKENEWIGWMDLNRTSVGGWGAGSYSCGLVLAANSSDLNNSTTTGYAVGFRGTGDTLVVFRFDEGITSGASDLPNVSTIVVSSGYIYANSDNGVNFYVKLESDGRWTNKYKVGVALSDASATNPANYNDGQVTSVASDETYSGPSYKYAGWIYAHSSGGSEKAYFDNFGIGTTDQSLPVELSYWSVKPSDKSVILNWTTESELDNLGFIIDRRIRAKSNMQNNSAYPEWIEIANYKSNPKLRGQGTVTHRTQYQYIDGQVNYGITYQYRLIDIDYQGIEKSHGTRSATVRLENTSFTAFPNPANPDIQFLLWIDQDAQVTVTIFDLRGKPVKTLFNGVVVRGEHMIRWSGITDRGSLAASGIYFVQLRIPEKTIVQKIIVAR